MATATVKPNTNAITGVINAGNWTNPANAYDIATGNDLTTYTAGNATASSGTSKTSAANLILSAIPALPVHTYSSKMLKVNWAVTLYTDPGVNSPYLYIYYSINGGSSWNLLGMETALGSGTLTHELGGAQDETQVQVKASVSAYTDGTVTTIIHTALYDVWIDGTYTPVAGSGKKAAANLA